MPGVAIAKRAACVAPGRGLSSTRGAPGSVQTWTAAVDDDLDLPKGLAIVRAAAKASDLPAAERGWLLVEADRVLGLDLAREIDVGAAAAASAARERPLGTAPDAPLPAGAAALLAERAAARAGKDWPRSDALRAELAAIGVVVVDRPGGAQEWGVRDEVT